MWENEAQAREQILASCRRLAETGLIQRTWGNISARLSEDTFLITPSGRAYETLTPEELVAVNIADGSYKGDIKPSSERGVHAEAYRLRPEVNFIIHTHQTYATAVGVGGDDLCMYDKYDPEAARLLGPWVPCAAYGTPGSKQLREAMGRSVGGNPRSKAFLMPMHGALCLGADADEAFAVADALERVAAHVVTQALQDAIAPQPALGDGGSSSRSGHIFRLTLDGAERIGAVGSGSLHGFAAIHAAIHAAIYGRSKANCILFVTDEHIRAFAGEGKVLPSRIDDLAQIAGVGIESVDPSGDALRIARRMSGRNAILLRGMGALCTGRDEADARAVAMILSKACLTERYAQTLDAPLSLRRLEAVAQRLVYVGSYAKQKRSC